MQRTYKVVYNGENQGWHSVNYVIAGNEEEARKNFMSKNARASILYLIDCG